MQPDNPIKVLFLHATWHVSSEYHVHRLLAESSDPHKVACYFLWQDSSHPAAAVALPQLAKPDRLILQDFGRDMSIRPAPHKWRRGLMMLSRLPFALYRTIRVIRAVRPDILYTSQQYYEVGLAHWLSRLFRIPHVIHISYPVGHWLGGHALRVIRQTPYLIACSDFVHETAVNYGIEPDHLHTLHHGAHLEMYDVVADTAAMRREFGWPEDAPVVVTAARLDPYKGHEQLLEAFAKVRTAVPEARLLVCGEGTTGTGYSKSIKQQAADLGLADVVQFAGYRLDLPQLLAASNVFCLPTENDALPLVFLAAMSAGLPVVGLRSGGVPEMVIHGQHGFLAEPGEVDTLAGYLITLLRDPSLARQLGANGRRYAQERHAPKKVVARWTMLLHRFLHASASQRAAAASPMVRMSNEQ